MDGPPRSLVVKSFTDVEMCPFEVTTENRFGFVFGAFTTDGIPIEALSVVPFKRPKRG